MLWLISRIFVILWADFQGRCSAMGNHLWTVVGYGPPSTIQIDLTNSCNYSERKAWLGKVFFSTLYTSIDSAGRGKKQLCFWTAGCLIATGYDRILDEILVWPADDLPIPQYYLWAWCTYEASNPSGIIHTLEKQTPPPVHSYSLDRKCNREA